eukprot:5463017-Prorocentrum_lima.AAC.1
MERHLQDIMRSTFQTTGWCPWWVPSAYGPIHGISGAPRCPRTTAHAALLIAALHDRSWGPAETRRRATR